jgi:hypothetical protein
MSELTVKDFVTKENTVIFDSFRSGVFYYNVQQVNQPFDVFQFQVPIDDIGTATLSREEKSVFYMRWIRKSLENKTFIKLS